MIIDWLSYTLPVVPTNNDQTASRRMHNAIYDSSPKIATWLFEQGQRQAKPRWPYCVSYRYGDVQTYAGIATETVLIEASGQACEKMRVDDILDTVINQPQARFTRIDVAIDIPDVTPDEIVEEGYSSVFKAHSRMTSKTGITHYIGSPKSDRYCRVYKYNEPHPRSGLCRVEMVHRRDYARIMAQSIKDDGLMAAGLKALASYKFQHSAVPTNGGDTLGTVAIIKGDQKTLRWILAQCAPAIKRLIKDGTIADPEEFFLRYFMP